MLGHLHARRALARTSVAILLLAVGACAAGSRPSVPAPTTHPGAPAVLIRPGATRETSVGAQFANALPGMPPVIAGDVYSRTRAGMLSPAVAEDRELVYVPDAFGHQVTVIDQRTRKVVGTYDTGFMTQHVVPSYDLKALYANASVAHQLVPFDPATGTAERPIPMTRPYNLYFTPDGKQAIVMVEQEDKIRFTDPHTFQTITDVQVPGCTGPNHADFSANGRFVVVSCEFSGVLVKIDVLSHKVDGVLKLPAKPIVAVSAKHLGGMAMPQDVRLSPDGLTIYTADMGNDEVVLIDPFSFSVKGAIATPSHPHGIYFSRDGNSMYVSDRGAGKVSVIDWRTNRITATWVIPGGGSPDMGGVSADGKELWLSGRYDHVVYVFDTATGKLIDKITVPEKEAHGLDIWPQPGRYSLGQTGNMR